MAETTSIRPGSEPQDPKTETLILARLATFDEAAKIAAPAREALDGMRKNLKHLARR